MSGSRQSTGAGWRRRLGNVLLVAGGILVVGVLAIRGLGEASASTDVEQFFAVRAEAARSEVPWADLEPAEIDFSLWDQGRIDEYRHTLTEEAGIPQAVLRLPSVDLDVAVHPGVDEWTLNRAVGWIPGTARPDEVGNVGIAGHRDGFFRVLKDVAVGHPMELHTLGGTYRYVVEEILIVRPEDVYVLDPTPGRAITLVTCYPFYFVGSAPERYIVRAVLVDDDTSGDVQASHHGG